MSTRCRGWFFTCWNVDPLAEWINSPNEKPYDSTLEWCHWQIEQCPTTERLHAQGACWFSNARTRDGVQKYFHESPQTMYYCEPIASLSGAHAYCAKEETRVTGPWTYGELPADIGRGHRSDLDHDGALALQGDLDSISISTRMRYDRGVAALYKEGNRLRWSRKEREVEVHILWGKPGTGKSRAFTNMYDYPFKGIKFKRDGTIWFDGYRGASHSYRRNGSGQGLLL